MWDKKKGSSLNIYNMIYLIYKLNKLFLKAKLEGCGKISNL